MTLELTSGEWRALRDAVYASLEHTQTAYTACGERKLKRQLSLERKRLTVILAKLEKR